MANDEENLQSILDTNCKVKLLERLYTSKNLSEIRKGNVDKRKNPNDIVSWNEIMHPFQISLSFKIFDSV